MKDVIDGIASRLGTAEERISERIYQQNLSKAKRTKTWGKKKKKEQNIQGLWNNYKR